MASSSQKPLGTTKLSGSEDCWIPGRSLNPVMRNVLTPKARDWAVGLASSQARVGRNCQSGQYIRCPSRGTNKDGVQVCLAQRTVPLHSSEGRELQNQEAQRASCRHDSPHNRASPSSLLKNLLFSNIIWRVFILRVRA